MLIQTNELLFQVLCYAYGRVETLSRGRLPISRLLPLLRLACITKVENYNQIERKYVDESGSNVSRDYQNSTSFRSGLMIFFVFEHLQD